MSLSILYHQWATGLRWLAEVWVCVCVCCACVQFFGVFLTHKVRTMDGCSCLSNFAALHHYSYIILTAVHTSYICVDPEKKYSHILSYYVREWNSLLCRREHCMIRERVLEYCRFLRLLFVVHNLYFDLRNSDPRPLIVCNCPHRLLVFLFVADFKARDMFVKWFFKHFLLNVSMIELYYIYNVSALAFFSMLAAFTAVKYKGKMVVPHHAHSWNDTYSLSSRLFTISIETLFIFNLKFYEISSISCMRYGSIQVPTWNIKNELMDMCTE